MFGRTINYLRLTKDLNLTLKSDGTMILDALELKQLVDLDRRNRYILEPFKTMQRKSLIIFRDSLVRFNLQGLLDYQREVSRDAFCKNGMVIGQGNCGNSSCSPTTLSGCAVAGNTVDGGHSHLGKDAQITMCLNVGMVIKL